MTTTTNNESKGPGFYDIGGRPQQEDRWAYGEFRTADDRLAMMALVADGIGGGGTGEIASELAKKTIPSFLIDASTEEPDGVSRFAASELARGLVAAIEAAHDAIFEQALADEARAGMGTTCTVVAIADRRLYLAHVGDSRAYLLRGQDLHQLTTDHNWGEEAIRMGRSPEEIRNHPNRHVLRRYLGMEGAVEVDTRYRLGSQGEAGGDTALKPLYLEPGDAILLCTDGVSGVLAPPQMAAILKKQTGKEAATAVVQAALKAGSTDNLAAVVINVPGGSAGAGGRKLTVWAIAAAAAVLVFALLVGLWMLRNGKNSAEPAAVAQVSKTPNASPSKPNAGPTNTSGVLVATSAATITAATATATRGEVPPGASATATVDGAPGGGAAEPTLVPTDTTIPPTPTKKPAQTPQVTSTRETPTTPGTQKYVDLVSPRESDDNSGPITFSWIPSFKLADNECYELVIFNDKQNEKPREGQSPIGCTRETSLQVNVEQLNGVIQTSGQDYRWTIFLCQQDKNGGRCDAQRKETTNLAKGGRILKYTRPEPPITPTKKPNE